MKIKKALLIFILSVLPFMVFAQNNGNTGTQENNSSDNLQINNENLPKLDILRPIKKFKGRLPIKAWINWNERRYSDLKIINDWLPYNYAYPIRRSISFGPMIIPIPIIASGGGSVVNANSATLYHRILRDDSANYGVTVNKKYNLYIVFEGVTKPKEDFKAYGIIYINKKRVGSTGKGLITQRKVFRTILRVNKHLLRIRVVIRDKYQRRWRSLLNTRQPKAKYFPIKKGYITLIKMTYKPLNKYKKYFFIGKFVKKSSLN